jgi:hypothetical protein
MSLVSPDNQQLTARVARIRAGYSTFETTLRGAVAEVMNGLGNGVYNLSNMGKPIEAVADAYLSAVREQTLEDLGEVSEIALKTSRAEIDSDVASKAITVADALYKGFAVEVESSVERAVAKDVKTSMEFLRTQIAQGRFVATTEQLTHDLQFSVSGKVTISSLDFITREVNWAYRQHYNTIMVHVLLGRDVEHVVVDGGSSDGLKLNLMQYDQVQAKIFHHNSKSLLQPLDEGI